MDRKKLFNLMKSKQFSSTIYSSTESDAGNQETIYTDDSKRIQSKLLNEKKKERKEKRDKLINANRDCNDLTIETNENERSNHIMEKSKILTTQSIGSSIQGENITQDFLSTTYLVGSSNIDSTNNAPQKHLSKSSSISTSDFHFAKPTFISNTRRQIIELWRKQKKEEDSIKDKRPPFKIYHLDHKILELPKLPQSSTFNFKMSINTTSKSNNQDSIHHRPITRSHTRRDLNKPPVPKSDFFSNIKLNILNNIDTSSLKMIKSNVPKSSSTSSLSSKQFMPLPQIPINIEPINSSIIKTNSFKNSKLDKDVDIIANRIDNNVFITQQDHFRPSLSSTILHSDLNETQTPIGNINNNRSIVVKSCNKLEKSHQEIKISNAEINNEQLEDIIIKIDKTVHSQSIIQTNNEVNICMEIQSDIKCALEEETKSLDHKQDLNTVKKETSIFVETKSKFDINNELVEISKLIKDLDDIEIEKRDTLYFRDLVKLQTENLNCLAKKYLAYCDDLINQVPDDIQGDIRSACGLAKLLIDERFNQFIELIDQCEHTNSNEQVLSEEIKLVKCSDLQGFWDMVDYQIKDVEKKFLVIDKLKENNYIRDDQLNRQKVKKSKPIQSEGNVNNKTSKPAVKSKFSQFKAMLKQQAQTGSVSDEIKVDVVQVKQVKEETNNLNSVKSNDSIQSTPIPAININGNAIIQSNLHKSAIKNSAQREIMEVGLPNDRAHDLEHSTKRYNLRSRPSDLIKFESPCSLCTPKKSLIRKSLSVVKKTPAAQLISNKENLDVCDEEEDIFSFQNEKVITWKVNRNIEPEIDNSNKTTSQSITNKLLDVSNSNSRLINSFRKSISNINSNNTPLKTPIRRTTSGRDSLNPGQITSVINSPLLKLAYISSHGKRLSISSNKI